MRSSRFDEVFDGLAYLFLILFFIEALAQHFNRSALFSGWRGPLALVVSLTSLLFWSNQAKVIHTPAQSFAGFTWSNLVFPGETPYFSDTDGDMIRSELLKIRPDSIPATVQFLPRSDGLLYANIKYPNLVPYSPIFDRQPADYYLIHRSRNLPPYWSGFEMSDIAQAGYDSLETKWLVHSRDSTEQWFLFPSKKTND